MASGQKGTFVDKHGMKKCASCLEIKPADFFHNVKKRRDGKDPHCKVCKKKQREERLARDPDYERRYRETYDYNYVGDDGLTYRQRYYLKNRKKRKESVRKYWHKNKHVLMRRYKSNHAALNATREAEKIRRTPSWLTKSHKKEISKIYKMRDKMSSKGILYQVDHMAPIMGANMCGLHVPWNLQVISKEENIKKGFIYEGDDAWPEEIQFQMRRERWDLFGRDACVDQKDMSKKPTC